MSHCQKLFVFVVSGHVNQICCPQVVLFVNCISMYEN